MCHQCNTGQPHICIASGGVYVSGKGPEFHSATYREEIPKGGVIEMVADDSCDDEEDGSPDPVTSTSIRSGGHLISTEPHLPTRANLLGISSEGGLSETDYRATLK